MKLIEAGLAVPGRALNLTHAALNNAAGRALAVLPLPLIDLSDSSGWFDDEEF